jgi:hypothetical protein
MIGKMKGMENQIEDYVDEDTIPLHEIQNKYVAYCDILGFSNKVEREYEETIKACKRLLRYFEVINNDKVQATMYSDAILLVSDELPALLSSIQNLWFVVLSDFLLIRGAVTYGKYWQHTQNDSKLIVSDALVRAVQLEKTISIPAVFIADDIEIEDKFWMLRFCDKGVFGTPLLHFRDRNIVNPVNPYWFQSARMRIFTMMEEHRRYVDKYLWFLALLDAIEANHDLIPPNILKRFLDDGVLKRSF